MKNREEMKLNILSQIEEYFNYKYKNISIEYKNSAFLIKGTDSDEMEYCRKEIEEILEFSAEKN